MFASSTRNRREESLSVIPVGILRNLSNRKFQALALTSLSGLTTGIKREQFSA